MWNFLFKDNIKVSFTGEKKKLQNLSKKKQLVVLNKLYSKKLQNYIVCNKLNVLLSNFVFSVSLIKAVDCVPANLVTVIASLAGKVAFIGQMLAGICRRTRFKLIQSPTTKVQWKRLKNRHTNDKNSDNTAKEGILIILLLAFKSRQQ